MRAGEGDDVMSERWTPTSWRDKPIQQVPFYPDATELKKIEAQLAGFPPLVFAGEARKLKKALAKVAAGESFLLEGGDFAGRLAPHSAHNIRAFFRAFSPIGRVLPLSGPSPVVQIGRLARRRAEPR